MKTLGSLWSLWVTRFHAHLTRYSFKFKHMGNVTLLDGNVVLNIISLAKELEFLKEVKSHGRGRY